LSKMRPLLSLRRPLVSLFLSPSPSHILTSHARCPFNLHLTCPRRLSLPQEHVMSTLDEVKKCRKTQKKTKCLNDQSHTGNDEQDQRTRRPSNSGRRTRKWERRRRRDTSSRGLDGLQAQAGESCSDRLAATGWSGRRCGDRHDGCGGCDDLDRHVRGVSAAERGRGLVGGSTRDPGLLGGCGCTWSTALCWAGGRAWSAWSRGRLRHGADGCVQADDLRGQLAEFGRAVRHSRSAGSHSVDGRRVHS